jgi:CRP/FNR family transcriptional regulator
VNGAGLKIIAGLCSRVRHLSNLVEDLTFKDVEERVMLALLRMAEEKAADVRQVNLAVTHQDIAAITGSVREVVSRTMSRLKKEGVIIDSSAKGFLIDKENLLKLLGRKEPTA